MTQKREKGKFDPPYNSDIIINIRLEGFTMRDTKRRSYVHCPERVSIRLTPEQRQKLENYSRETGISMSWMIATLIDSYIPEAKKVA